MLSSCYLCAGHHPASNFRLLLDSSRANDNSSVLMSFNEISILNTVLTLPFISLTITWYNLSCTFSLYVHHIWHLITAAKGGLNLHLYANPRGLPSSFKTTLFQASAWNIRFTISFLSFKRCLHSHNFCCNRVVEQSAPLSELEPHPFLFQKPLTF